MVLGSRGLLSVAIGAVECERLSVSQVDTRVAQNQRRTIDPVRCQLTREAWSSLNRSVKGNTQE